MRDETATPEPVVLRTADGLALEGQLGVPPGAWAAVVLAHPHPQFGGTMRSIVTGALFDALYEHGVAVLRVLAEHDQYRSPEEALPILSTWTATEVEVVPGADHYFVGRTDRVVELCVAALRRLT